MRVQNKTTYPTLTPTVALIARLSLNIPIPTPTPTLNLTLIHEDNEVLFRFDRCHRRLVTNTKPAGCLEKNAVCPLCRENQSSLKHIHSSCNSKCAPSALTQGRYTWRHDSILLALYQQIRFVRNKGSIQARSRVTCSSNQVRQ